MEYSEHKNWRTAAAWLCEQLGLPDLDLERYYAALDAKLKKANSRANIDFWRAKFGLPPREQQQEQDKTEQDAKEEEKPQPAETSILHWHGETSATARPWLVKNLLPETGVALISGQWGTGKTYIALELAGAIMLSSQTYFIDYRIKRHGGVLFIAAEGAGSIPLRLQVMLETKFDPQGPQPFTWADCLPDLLRYGAQGLIQLAAEAAAGMRERFGCELALIIIDTVAAAAAWSDENDAAQAQKVMNALSALSAASGALVVGCDHFGKEVSTGTRGSSAKEGSADGILALVGERTLTGKMTNLVLGVRKVRDGEQGREIPYRLEVIDCGVDEDGDHTTTCVVRWEPGRSAAPRKSGRPSSRYHMFVEALTAALTAAGEIITSPAGESVRAVRRQVVAMKFKELYKDSSKNPAETFRKAYGDVCGMSEIKSCKIDGVEWFWPAAEVL
jgi:AAA domain